MFAILCGANGRRHEVDFLNDPVSIEVAMSATVIQITMTADDETNPATRRYVTIALPREKLLAAPAVATAKAAAGEKPCLRAVNDRPIA
jgi:hypothetical protein